MIPVYWIEIEKRKHDFRAHVYERRGYDYKELEITYEVSGSSEAETFGKARRRLADLLKVERKIEGRDYEIRRRPTISHEAG